MSGSDHGLARLAFLARAGEILASSLDYEATLEAVAHLAVPDLAAWCTVDLLEEDGSLGRVAVAHADPAKVALARELQQRYPPDPEAPHGVGRVVRTGEPELVPAITDEMIEAVVRGDDELARVVRGLGLTSYVCVPLESRGRTLGALTLVSDDARRRFGEPDLELAQELARRAAAAVENARLHRSLVSSEERYRLLFERNPLPMWVYDAETLKFLAVNEAAVRHYGYSSEEFLAMRITEIRPREDVEALMANLAEGAGSPVPGTWRHRRKDGTLIDVEITAGRIEFQGRDAALVLAHDVTERKRLEQQLAQAQKMDAIGRLAGGVAHDFNNLLTVISGYASILLARRPDVGRKELGEIAHAAEQAARLTRQLLAFGRRQVLHPERLDVNEIVSGMESMLDRIIGEDVDVAVRLAADLAPVEVDRGQLERVIVNLAANARDAMPTGGQLTIETANVELAEEYVHNKMEGTPGPNVMLAVSDTGVGMSDEVRQHLFEPFFTTKPGGAGTGLGLATVFGVVKQSGGSIFVYSEEGKGTTFKIYLPAARAPAPAGVPAEGPARLRGAETVMLVEDDERVRDLVQAILERQGYDVIVADGAEDAVRRCAERPQGVDLLLTDVVMPHVSGPELAQRLTAVQPSLRVLFMSGYADEAVYRHGLIRPDAAFIEKPFPEDALAQKVREVLDGAPQRG